MSQTCALSALMVCLVASSAAGAPSSFVHPGVLVDANRIALLQSNYADPNGLVPIPAFWESITRSIFARQREPLGPPPGGIINCGFFNHPDVGCSNETTDSAAAYILSLMFAVNGSQAYADAAIAIMNAYAYGLREYNDSNAALQAGWSGSKWARAAELLKHTPNSGWAPSDAAAFETMLYTVTLPRIYNGSSYNGNWELSMIEAMIGLAVLSENGTLFDHAVTMWQGRVPAYFYISSDGPAPRPLPNGQTPYWENQLVFNASVDGICQETCRDLGHTQFGLAAAFNTLETATIQGVELAAPFQTRLTAALEFHSNLLLGAPPPAYVCNGTGVKVSEAPTFEVAFNAYHNRRGVPLPLTQQHILTQVRNVSCGPVIYMMVYESLTHGAEVNITTPALA